VNLPEHRHWAEVHSRIVGQACPHGGGAAVYCAACAHEAGLAIEDEIAERRRLDALEARLARLERDGGPGR
jgi:UDP-N-acetylmuramyl pentapeptide synthase